MLWTSCFEKSLSIIHFNFSIFVVRWYFNIMALGQISPRFCIILGIFSALLSSCPYNLLLTISKKELLLFSIIGTGDSWCEFHLRPHGLFCLQESPWFWKYVRRHRYTNNKFHIEARSKYEYKPRFCPRQVNLAPLGHSGTSDIGVLISLVSSHKHIILFMQYNIIYSVFCLFYL